MKRMVMAGKVAPFEERTIGTEVIYTTPQMRALMLFFYSQALHASTAKRTKGLVIEPVGEEYWDEMLEYVDASLTSGATPGTHSLLASRSFSAHFDIPSS